ncbi:MAG: metal-dependent hydrolase [Candidatus Asgardarchaeia archaeon]
MNPSAHMAIGIILSSILLWLFQIDTSIVFLIVLGSIMPDFDFILSSHAPNKNHRMLVTHTPVFWLLMLCLSVFFQNFFFLAGAAIIHILFDTIDWGVMVTYPFSKKLNSHLLPEPPKNILSKNMLQSQCWFFKTYFSNKLILMIEVVSWCVATALSLIFIFELWLYFIFYEVVIFVEIMFWNRCKKLVT